MTTLTVHNDFDFEAEMDAMYHHYTTTPHLNYYTKSKDFHAAIAISEGGISSDVEDYDPNQGMAPLPADAEAATDGFKQSSYSFTQGQNKYLSQNSGQYKEALGQSQSDEDKNNAKWNFDQAMSAGETQAKQQADSNIHAYYQKMKAAGSGKSKAEQMKIAHTAGGVANFFTKGVLGKIMGIVGTLVSDIVKIVDQVFEFIKNAFEDVIGGIEDFFKSIF